MKKSVKQPSKILNNILGLIDRDVRAIKKTVTDRLLPADAHVLTRYVQALASVLKEAEKLEEKNKKQLDQMDTASLIDLYMKEKSKEKT